MKSMRVCINSKADLISPRKNKNITVNTVIFLLSAIIALAYLLMVIWVPKAVAGSVDVQIPLVETV